jgi:dTDP-4-amino-4,6-dideoxygalactose transaminase
MSLGVGPGDEVIIPDFTFPATANAVVACGARPVSADILPDTFNLDPAAAADRITGATRALMPVHQFGLAVDPGPWRELCERHGLRLVEDAACALGASVDGRMAGSMGETAALSFHPRKVLTTGEGGMVLTDNREAAERVRLLRNHGLRTAGGAAEFVLAGYNMRMTEIQAVLGISQMDGLEDGVENRRRAAAIYDRLLAGVDEVRTPAEPRGRRHTYQSYVVMLDDRIDRDAVIGAMRDSGVETGIGTYAVHAQPYYSETLGLRPGDLPESFRAWRQSLSLPMYGALDEETVVGVVQSLKTCIAGAGSGT